MRKILCLFILMTLLAGCSSAPEQPTALLAPPTGALEVYADAQLMAEIATREEAEEIAGLYGITLVEYGDGLACFHTREDPFEVIRRGQENGWPELQPNYVSTAF